MFKLTKTDKEYLRKIGNTNEDIAQIEECADGRNCLYFNHRKKRIPRKRVIDMIGRTEWLSALSRCAFHCTTSRQADPNNKRTYVGFDCSKWLLG